MRAFLLAAMAALGSYAWSRIRADANALKLSEFGANSSNSDRWPQELIVGCYNIAHGRGGEVGASNRRPDGRAGLIAHLKAIGSELGRQGLDIVVLNEVDFSSSWSWRVNQAEVIAKEAGLPYVLEQRSYDASLLFYRWGFGNAILSRFPISDVASIEYPAFKSLESLLAGKKDGCVASVTTPIGELRVVAVHLEVRDQATREASMEVLQNLAAADPRPYLIMGDFNTQAVFAGSERLRSAGGFDATFPSAKPERRIDWIFSRDLELEEDVVFGGSLSDHLGLRTRVIPLPQPKLESNAGYTHGNAICDGDWQWLSPNRQL